MDLSFLTDTAIFKILVDIMPTGIRFHPYYILPFIGMGFLIFMLKRKSGTIDGSFWGWLFPKEYYKHRSTLLDTQLGLFGRALVLLKVINSMRVAGKEFLDGKFLNPFIVHSTPPVAAA